MDKKYILELPLTTTDPKNNREFLWLSYSINNLSSVKHEKVYWMTLEKRCLSLFSDNGYDLQTGAWFCLISTHLYSWEGLAIASWKFVDSFVNKNCWPLVIATEMRTNILAWYIKNVIPTIHTLPDYEKSYSSLTLLEDSLTLLSELEFNLFHGKSFIISNMLSELKRQKSSHCENSQSLIGNLSLHVDKNVTHESSNSSLIIKLKNTSIFRYLSIFILGILTTLFVNYLGKPETALKIKSVIPDSFLTEIAMSFSGCSEYTPDPANSWTMLSQKIDNFALTLNTIENNGDYITISKLKTIAYDMKNSFLAYDTPINIKISKLYNNEHADKEDILRELEIIKNSISKFNCQIAEINLKNQ